MVDKLTRALVLEGRRVEISCSCGLGDIIKDHVHCSLFRFHERYTDKVDCSVPPFFEIQYVQVSSESEVVEFDLLLKIVNKINHYTEQKITLKYCVGFLVLPTKENLILMGCMYLSMLILLNTYNLKLIKTYNVHLIKTYIYLILFIVRACIVLLRYNLTDSNFKHYQMDKYTILNGWRMQEAFIVPTI